MRRRRGPFVRDHSFQTDCTLFEHQPPNATRSLNLSRTYTSQQAPCCMCKAYMWVPPGRPSLAARVVAACSGRVLPSPAGAAPESTRTIYHSLVLSTLHAAAASLSVQVLWPKWGKTPIQNWSALPYAHASPDTAGARSGTNHKTRSIQPRTTQIRRPSTRSTGDSCISGPLTAS